MPQKSLIWTICSSSQTSMGIYQDGMYPMLKDAKISYENVLIRTILDNKIFNGRVFSKEDFLIFQQECLRLYLSFVSI